MSASRRQRLARRASGIAGRIIRIMPAYPVGVKYRTDPSSPDEGGEGSVSLRPWNPLGFALRTGPGTVEQ